MKPLAGLLSEDPDFRSVRHALAQCFVAAIMLNAAYLAAIGSESKPVDLLQLSLEELGHVQVTTVSRKSEDLSTAAAAVHVITQEDIRRSGANSLPETLRLAPGLDVARANSRQWAISSRGFNDLFANKLLVLMDGRTIYTPLFSGVFWEDTDTFLPDVDRIEVIRGPGATLWGANAVNGIINIITKSARDTRGALVTGGGGIEERGFGGVRYGGQLGDGVFYRVYGKYADRDEFTLLNGGGAGDSWWTSQGGFRVDWEVSDEKRFTVQGDYYYGEWSALVRRHSLSPPGMVSDRVHDESQGGNILARWTQQFGDDSELSVQSYYDRADRGFGIGNEVRDTFDLDVQQRVHFGERQEFVFGAGYRFSGDEITGSRDLRATDPSKNLQSASLFLQDEITIVPERVHLIAGSKFEHNDFTGVEIQPSARIAWTPEKRHTVWAAISRAVRTPSRAERGFQFYSDPPPSVPRLPIPVLIPASGNPDFRSEELLSAEIGWRTQLHPRLSLDLAAFYNEYDHLYNVVQLPAELRVSPSGAPYLALPVTDNNALYGETYGGELSVTWQPLDRWRLRTAYTFLEMSLHTRGAIASFTEESEGDSPTHQFSIWSDLDLPGGIECSVGFRFVDALPSQDVAAYSELDARLAWRPSPNCELALTGRNLLRAHHQEFSPFLFWSRDVQVDRAVYGSITWRF